MWYRGLGYSLCLPLLLGVLGVEAAQGGGYENSAAQVQPLTTTKPRHIDRAKLGEKLFSDPILSDYGGVSCSTCHDLSAGGDDGVRFSATATGALKAVNTPTVFNATSNFVLTWKGKRERVEELVRQDIISKGLIGTDWPTLLNALRQRADYVSLFESAYAEGITQASVIDAIASFQRTLVTPNAPFDRYLRGQDDAITADQKYGYDLFRSYGCVSCHQGKNIGGNMYQKLGLFGDYFGDLNRPLSSDDLGRYSVTEDENDRHYFRVPSLRNVALTAPYLHDGSAETLDDAIKIMAHYQLGRPIPANDRQKIAAFLTTLTGDYLRLAYESADP